MFTGIVSEIGRVASAETGRSGGRLGVESALAAELSPGDSIAVNGACVTAAEVSDGSFRADVMNQTLARTSLGALSPGDGVNLELPLRLSDRLGGHLVQGHVDATGTVSAAEDDGLARWITIDAPPELRRYLVERGSVAVEGVSLTVAALVDGGFAVSLVPETLERTTLGAVSPGAAVNLEADMIARYVESLLSAGTTEARQ